MTEDLTKQAAIRHAVTEVINELLNRETTKKAAIETITKILDGLK